MRARCASLRCAGAPETKGSMPRVSRTKPRLRTGSPLCCRSMVDRGQRSAAPGGLTALALLKLRSLPSLSNCAAEGCAQRARAQKFRRLLQGEFQFDARRSFPNGINFLRCVLQMQTQSVRAADEECLPQNPAAKEALSIRSRHTASQGSRQQTPAVSGADPIDTRPGFRAQRIVGNGVRTVIVEDASRFARTLMVQEAGIAALAGLGVRVLTSRGDDHTRATTKCPSRYYGRSRSLKQCCGTGRDTALPFALA